MKQTILFTFLMCSQFVFAQIAESYVETSQNTVIAKNGLRMRSAPNLQGDKILTIPFGKEVEILSDLSYGKLLENGETSQDKEANLLDNFVGDWAKISYNGKIGYACNAYLYYSFSDEETLKDEKEKDINQDIVLLKTESNCISNIYPQKGRYWYGLSENNQLEAVEVEYSTSYADGVDAYFLETSSTGDNADFIIGSKEPMQSIQLYNDFTKSLFLTSKMDEKAMAILQKHNITFKSKEKDNESFFMLILERDGKQQVLNPNREEQPYDYAVNIEWAGDIDGDGKSDFIISYGEESVQCILYLSSKATGNQLVKPVAVWYTGYCC